MNRGEVWWVEDERGRRPACVLTRQEAVPILGRLTVVPATRTIRGIATEVELGREDGMPSPCALSLDNVRTVSKGRLTKQITTLSATRMQEVCTALDRAVGC